MIEWKETELGKIPFDWMLYTIGQLVEDKIIDKPLDGNHGEIHPKGSDFVETGIPFVMATDINNGKVDLVNCKFITKEQADSLNKGFSISEDVLLTHKASLGRTAVVGKIQTPYIMLTPQVTYYRVRNKSLLNNKYLKYFFDSPAFQDTLVNHGDSGSTRAYVGITAQRELPIILPSNMEEQKAIASVLSSLDDKIDLLHRQNKTLEAMAETLFRQWFVEEAEIPSENQLILGELIESVSITHKLQTDKIVFLNTSDIYKGDILVNSQVNVSSLPGQAKKSILRDDILFSEIRPANGRWAYIYFDADDYVVSTKLMVLRSKGTLSQAFVYFYLTNSQTVSWLQVLAESRSGTFPQITFDQIRDLKINIPSDSIQNNSIEWCKSALQKLNSNTTQIRTLETLRDTLLPKLMSGEVRVTV